MLSRDRRAWVFDALLAVGFTAAVLGISHRIETTDNGERALDALAYVCIAVAGLSLAGRRRFPMTVLVVSTLAIVVYAGRQYSGGPVYLAPIFAMYTVGAAYPRRQWAIAISASAALITVVGFLSFADTGVRWFHIVYFTWCIAAGFVGDAARSRRDYFAGLEARNRSLEESREEEARRRVAEERLRIARDLHDVVAHSLASINVQAAAGAHVAAAHPDQAQAALDAIKRASKDALDELRTTLGALRSGVDGAAAPRAPVPSLQRLDALVERTRAAGLPVTVTVEGSAGPIPSAVDAAAYRIVQESLTNTLRHAGPAAAVVTITYLSDAVELDVRDDGLGSAVLNTSPGHGIAGMRERAIALGGSLETRAVAGGGFRVHAVLPTRVGAVR
jgi:signal transduction histidine kinase